MDTVHIRWMIRRDLPNVVSIEKDSFCVPWTEDEFINQLRQRDMIGMVITVCGTAQGYMLYRIAKDHIELVSLAVAKSQRRRGLAAALLVKLQGKLSDRRDRLYADVNDANLNSHLLLQACGFIATEIFHGQYDECDDDMYRFEFHRKWLADQPELLEALA